MGTAHAYTRMQPLKEMVRRRRRRKSLLVLDRRQPLNGMHACMDTNVGGGGGSDNENKMDRVFHFSSPLLENWYGFVVVATAFTGLKEFLYLK